MRGRLYSGFYFGCVIVVGELICYGIVLIFDY